MVLFFNNLLSQYGWKTIIELDYFNEKKGRYFRNHKMYIYIFMKFYKLSVSYIQFRIDTFYRIKRMFLTFSSARLAIIFSFIVSFPLFKSVLLLILNDICVFILQYYYSFKMSRTIIFKESSRHGLSFRCSFGVIGQPSVLLLLLF